MKKCKFCKEYNKLKKLCDDDNEEGNGWSDIHKVSIRTESYFEGKKGCSSVSVKSFEINYCPECGKAMKESEENG